MQLTISKSNWRAQPKFHWFQSSSTKLTTPICSLQSIPLPLLDLLEDSDAVVLRCGTFCWQHVGVDGFFPVVTRSWKRWYLMVSRWSLSFPFSTMVMTFSSAAMTWCFDEFILLDTSACSRNVLFAFTSFNPAAFPITNNLDVSYCITPPGRHVLPDFVPYQVNSRASDGCSFLWFGSEVDIVLVSISKMNQENKRVSVITHQQYCFTGVWDFQCQWNMLYFITTRGIPRRHRNHCLLSLFFFFCRVLHTMFSHLRAHVFARSVTMARSSAVQAPSSRRQERRRAIVGGSPQSQSTDWASSR